MRSGIAILMAQLVGMERTLSDLIDTIDEEDQADYGIIGEIGDHLRHVRTELAQVRVLAEDL
jgi:hypothetical protein